MAKLLKALVASGAISQDTATQIMAEFNADADAESKVDEEVQKVMDTETAPAWSFCYVDCYGQATVSVDDSDYSNNEVVVSSPRPSFDLIGGTTVAVVEAATERQAQNAFRAAFPYQRWCFDRSQVCGACFDEVSRVERVSS